MVRAMISLLLVGMLAGCAAMSESECRLGDWYGAGERDGRQGQPDRLPDYAQACNKLRILPDPAEYSRGRERGLQAYCTPEVGYQEGVSGRAYHNVCNGQQQTAFLYEYEKGRQLYELRQELAELRSRLQRHVRQLHELSERIDKSKDKDERKRLQDERQSLERSQNQQRQRLNELEARLTSS